MKKQTSGKRTYFLTHISVLALLTAIVITANLLMTNWDSALTDFFGTVGGTQTSAQAGDFTSDFASAEKLHEAQLDFTRRVVNESVTLLKNDNAALPLKAGAKLSVFGLSSVVAAAEGTGSGDIAIDSDTLAGALGKAGFGINQELIAFTAKSGHRHGTGAGPGGGDARGDWKIDEIPQSQYTDAVWASCDSYGDAAIVIFTRDDGEGSDLPREMGRFGNSTEKHYLQLTDEEEDLLKAIKASGKFAHTIVVVNMANPFELGFLEDEAYGVDACLWYAGTGKDGILSVADIFAGKVSPSGRVVDTYAYSALSAPAMQNFGDFRYVNADGSLTGYSYMNYGEGIYMGYRYYETRYEDVVLGTANVGAYDYAKTVQFPFGYGLSYTTFEWSDYKLDVKDDKGTATLTVKNTGSVPGKDVVELYAQAPYAAGGVEKASVVLAGYAKTKELKPGESEKITVTFSMKDIASYDFITNKTWILDPGTYYVTAGRNAHDAVNNILAAKGFTTANGMTADGNAKLAASFEHKELTLLDTAVTGNKVTNRFDNDAAADAVYLSRSNWSAMDNNGLRYSTADVAGISKNTDAVGTAGTIVLSDELRAIYANGGADSVDLNELSKQSFPSKEDYVYGAEPTLKLVDMKGATYDDPRWDELLNQTKLSEQHILFNNSGYGTKAIEAIEKPKTYEYDGPAGVSNFITGKGGFGYANTIMLAATWNQALAEEYGKFIAEDCLITKTSGWYAPATNMHRSPFSGRNYEYFSEDPFQSGIVTANIIKNVQKKGVYVYMKHFALNDQETNRTANGQVSVWAQEQAIREIYLKPFQMGVEDGGALGIMLAMNRIGSTWTGAHYPLMTEVCRNEWGFKGLFITDYVAEMETSMIDKLLAGGGNLVLSTSTLPLSDAKANWCRAYLRENTHRALYIMANSLAMNGLGGDVKFEVGTPIYKIGLWIADGLLAIYALYSIMMMIIFGRMSAERFAAHRAKYRKARMIKNIIIAVVVVGVLAYAVITYLPVLQKAFTI